MNVPLGSVSVASPVEGILRIDEVLIVHPDLFLADPEIVMKVAFGRSVDREERLHKGQRQVVAGDRFKDSLFVDVL